ncbi:MAG: C1 family peptidase [Chloroflexia bacterium]
MADYDYGEPTENAASGFSGFGGHLLTRIAGGGADGAERAAGEGPGGDGYVATLASLGIEDAEQLVAIAAVPEVRDHLQAALGVKNKELQTLLDRVRGALPPERATLMSTPASKDLGLGVLPPPDDIIAAAEASAADVAAGAAPVTLPAAVNLVAQMPPIRNQQSRGTCVAFALTALNEYTLRRRGIQRDLSEQHLYYETKLIDGDPNGCGTFQSKAVIVLQTRGECPETIWPYNPNLPCNNHGPRPAQARPMGINSRLTTLLVPARNVQAYKTHMSQRRPVTMSIPVYDSWYYSAETRRSGRITMPIGNEQPHGGHALLLVGYQDTPTGPGGGYFIVRNSWGTANWGYQCPYGAGYGTIPYQYITNYAWEAYTAQVPAGSEDDDGGGQVVTGPATVTIDVGPNIKITITTT